MKKINKLLSILILTTSIATSVSMNLEKNATSFFANKTSVANSMVDNYQQVYSQYWNDANFPNHFPVERELNFFLWYGLIPFAQRLGQNFADYSTAKFGTADAFVSSVLGGIASIGANEPSGNTSDPNKKQPKYQPSPTMWLKKSPFTVSQRMQSGDKSSLPRDFGPKNYNLDKSGVDNDQTSWVVSFQVTLPGGQFDGLNVPGYDSSITNSSPLSLNASNTQKFLQAVQYNEYLLSIYFLDSLTNQLQQKSSGTALYSPMLSYWQNLSSDSRLSNNDIQIHNPYARIPNPPVNDPDFLPQTLYVSKFLQDFVTSVVKRVPYANTPYKLSWADDKDNDLNKKTTVNFTEPSTDASITNPLPLLLISDVDASAADATRYQINQWTIPKVAPNGQSIPGLITYSLNPNAQTPSAPQYANPFNYFWKQAFLGMALYAGQIPQWLAFDNASYTGDGADFEIIDKIMSIYFNQNFVKRLDPKVGAKTLYQSFLTANTTAPNSYLGMAQKATEDFHSFVSSLLSKELWKQIFPITKDASANYNINDKNKIIKPLKVSPSTKSYNDSLKNMSNGLIAFNNAYTKSQYDPNLVPNRSGEYYVFSNFGSLIKDIKSYNGLTQDNTTRNLIIIFSVLGVALILFFLLLIFRHEQIIKNLKRRQVKKITERK